MKLSLAVAGTALVLSAGSSHAQPGDPATNTVLVTATRTARTADESLASVTIITRDDIERRQSQDVVDLLRAQAGIDIHRSGGTGGNVDLFLRGTNQEHTLVLIDGVRAASSGNGSFDWRSLPLAQIERIEIVRGPRASLYGSDAIGGVIQIFTRRPKGADVVIAGGSDHTRRAEAAWGTTGRVRTFVTGSHFETEGFSAQNERAGMFFNPDKDGSRMQGFSGGLDAVFDQHTRLEVSGREGRGYTEYDEGVLDIDNRSLSARLTQVMSPAWTQSLTLGALHDALVDRSFSRFATRRHTVDWQNDIILGPDSSLTAGLTYFEESAVSKDLPTGAAEFDRRQRDKAAFALWQSRFDANDIQLSGRYDDYSAVGGHGTWSAAYGRALSDATRAWISYGTAFHAPTLIDLYHPGLDDGRFAGNPDLVPERSRTAEAGMRHRFQAKQVASVALFATHVDQLINSSGPNFQSINIAEADIRGAEIEYRHDGEYWHAATALTLLRTRDGAGRRLPRRADEKFWALLERRFGRGAVGAEIVAESDRFDGAFTNVVVPGYGIVNLAARYALKKSLLLEARVENVFDKEYQVIESFNTPDRSIFVALRYQSPTAQ